ncbi:pyrroline-5-carboxylate reductase [Lactonifactor longoviformis]|uniref:NADP oxidoreductase coenzyme F420-dependent n=1 Tax=Lactonifactor longoviformis DSM 17459 TaxID=1122155 RepID=A0A1M4YHD0_9CLOT|nr:pyrroline-5-carboxylate reductase dimerization domain-containing protein [Lactonifactor longoviformis]POP32959.1 pyrroline-5-carboxylate reductase [Lactonifactor longoviformis]SHF05187.1 NADP oxidoreductase coenzyme F420-dependent [Lactonifactor longoviformis DSM 17459]
MLRYGFIAAGNIIRAMHTGAELNEDYNPAEIGIYDINEDTRKDYASKGYATFDNMKELVDHSEMLVLGVTPKVAGLIIDELKACYRPGQLMLTVVTGIEQPWYTEHLGEDCKVVICMPNMSSRVGAGAFAVSRNANCTDEDVEKVTSILRLSGIVEEIPDGMMAEILPFNGSAPGFFYHISNLMIKEAEKYGLNPDTAIRLFAQTMKGSAEMILSSDISLKDLETALRLPGGATVTALEKIESMGFDEMYEEFVKTSVEHCRKLGNQ